MKENMQMFKMVINSLKFFQKQVKCYELFKKYDIPNIPKVYYSYISECGTDFMFIMEDLSPKYKPILQFQQMNLQNMNSVIQAMAVYHSFFSDKTEIFNLFPSRQNKEYELIARKFLSQNPSSIIDEKFYVHEGAVMEGIFKRLDQKLQQINFKDTPLEKFELSSLLKDFDYEYFKEKSGKIFLQNFNFKDPIVTLCHGDLRSENILFSNNGCMIIDWQGSCTSNPLDDLHQFLIINLTPQQKYTHWGQLQDRYLQRLQELINRKFTNAQLDFAMDKATAYQIAFTSVLVQQMLPIPANMIEASLKNVTEVNRYILVILTIAYRSLTYVKSYKFRTL